MSTTIIDQVRGAISPLPRQPNFATVSAWLDEYRAALLDTAANLLDIAKGAILLGDDVVADEANANARACIAEWDACPKRKP